MEPLIVIVFILLIVTSLCPPLGFVLAIAFKLLQPRCQEWFSDSPDDTTDATPEESQTEQSDFLKPDTRVNRKWSNDATLGMLMKETEYAKDGDQQLYEAMRNVSGKNREASLHRSRFTSDNFGRIFKDELDEQESRVWWENENLDLQMVKDGVDYSMV